MPRYDVVIKGGTVIDGLRTPRYKADIAIKDGRIALIGSVDATDGGEVVDASGKIVAPGFVDLHTHYDSQVFWVPWCTMSGWHGVTSVVIGNCGFGFAPCRPEDQDRAMLTVSRNEAVPLKTMRAGMPWDWQTFPEYLDSVDRTPKGVNIMSLVPLTPLYQYVVGVDKAKEKRASDEELDEMCRLIVEGMEAGACGWSSQILGDLGNMQRDYDGTPMVTDQMSEREVIAFARALRGIGRGTTQITGPLETAALIARESGRPIIWNALGVSGTSNQHDEMEYPHRVAIERLRQLNEDEGVRVFAQASSVRFRSEINLEEYNLMDVFPAWREACLGTIADKIAKFADPVRRTALKETIETTGGGFGSTFAVAAELKAGFGTTMIEFDPKQMAEVANSTMALPGVSDGGAHTKFITTGRYATEMLAHWVRECEIMSLEDAHWRLSAYPAMAVGLKDRGLLAEDKPADVTVYDPDTVDCLDQERLFDYPAGEWRLVQKAVGYEHIIVNGVTTFIDGKCTDATPGQLLRHGSA